VNDPAEMAARLRPWLEKPGVLAEARATAWRLGEVRFNWNIERGKFVDAVSNALAESARGLRTAGAQA
jgi:hypothetical protein